LTQVQQNRQGFYNGLLTQAGSAAQLPQYKGTLGADLSQAQKPQAPTSRYTEGQTASGPNGAKMVFKSGKWVPLGR
jgi:hypothetical protein